MKIGIAEWIGIGFGLAIAVGAFVFFGVSVMSYFLGVVAVVLASLPFLISIVSNQSIQREKEEKFLAFSRDLVENVKSGTPVVKSILNLQKRDYGPLSPHVQKLANQLSLGLTLTAALITFAKETKSPVISRAVGLISEAEKAGGQIESVLDSVAKSINQIEDLKKERKASVSNLITQGYIIFMVFIIIMLVLEFKILPLVSDLATPEGNLAISTKSIDPGEFSMPLFLMLIVQSLFAGLVIGKVSEGDIKSGIKHSFILLALTLLITTGSRVLFGA
jgi:archaeal flagellar protein FlaJ